MKRYNNLFEKIIDIDNLLLAHYNARKGKTHYSEVQEIDKDPIFYCEQIQQMLINNTYNVSNYRIKEIYEPKHRIIYILPYYPDRIIQHAIMQVNYPTLLTRGWGLQSKNSHNLICYRIDIQ